MIEINIGPVHIKIGRPAPIKVDFLSKPTGAVERTVEEVTFIDETADPLAPGKVEKNVHKNLRHARILASQHGWREIWHREEEARVRFKKGTDDYLDIWYTKMTVGTVITHPTKGRSQLFRKNVTHPLLGQIFKNPRVHTGEGYYER